MQEITLWNIVKSHKVQITGTMFLLLLENALFLLHPLLIGFAIDGATEKNYYPLWIMISFYILSIIIGTIRRMVDTRIYANIHFNIAEKILAKPSTSIQGQQSCKIARVEMTSDIIETLNEDIPMFIESVFQIVGSFIILAQFHLSYFTISLAICMLIVFIYTFYTKRIYHTNRKLNNSYEFYIRGITLNNVEGFSKHFKRMTRYKIQLSDLESRVYAILYVGILFILVTVLLQEVGNANVTTGGIFSVLSYVLQFEEGIAELPYLYQKVVGTNEIVRRLNTDE